MRASGSGFDDTFVDEQAARTFLGYDGFNDDLGGGNCDGDGNIDECLAAWQWL